MLISTQRAPDSSVPSSSGLTAACSAAMRARSIPSAWAEPIMARPISAIAVRTSWKSTLTRPGTLMISAIPPTALRSTLSAERKQSSKPASSPNTSSSLSLRTTISESTCLASSSTPLSATRRRFSKSKGLVTTATVRMPSSLAISATTGAAPVPVPPPMPAVMKHMCAPSSAAAISSRDSWAAARPASGLEPAPRPVVPSWTLTGAMLRKSAWASVLAQMKSTPCTPSRIM